MAVSRRHFVRFGSVAALGAATRIAGDQGGEPLSASGADGPSTAVVESVEPAAPVGGGGEGPTALVRVTHGGESRRLPLTGFPEGFLPEPGELVAVGAGRGEASPLVDRVTVPAGVAITVDDVTRTSGAAFVTPAIIPLPDATTERVAFVTRPTPASSLLPRAIAVQAR